GITGEVTISITNGEFKIDDGDYTSENNTITNNQTLQIRLNSSTVFSAQTTTSLSLGDVNGDFSVSTVAQDITADVFSFADVENATLVTQVESEVITVKGITGEVTISITNGEFKIDDGDYTTSSSTITNNQNLTLRALSSDLFSTQTTATLILGNVTASFNVTTEVEDLSPDLLVFNSQTDVVPNAFVLSNIVTIDGINTPVPVGIVGGLYSINGGEFTSNIGNIKNGETLQLKHQTAPDLLEQVNTTITISDQSFVFYSISVADFANTQPTWQTPDAGITQNIISDTADGAVGVMSVDLNKDGDMDVLSANCAGDSIVWYENTGSQSFTEHVITNAADCAWTVIVADVDGDNHLDVLSASWRDDTVSWYKNDGNQSFTKYVIDGNAKHAFSVVTAYVDDDDDLDIVTASRDDDTVAWYENDGVGGFIKHVIDNAADGAFSVSTAYINNDDYIDVIAASENDDTVAWYENNGLGGFVKHVITSTAIGAHSVGNADIDGDGFIDVLSASSYDNTIAWYENDGAGNFIEHVIDNNASGSYSVSSADLDGDGDIDVLSASSDNGNSAWYENDGSNGFIKHMVTSTDVGTFAVSTGDINGDGYIDVLSASYSNDSIAWYDLNAIVYVVNEGNTYIAMEIANDLDGNLMSYQIVDALDSALISVDSVTGELAFKMAPQFVVPLDINVDNIYEFTISASDGFATITRRITVEVLPVMLR
ncbi:MAG: FG-GAP-like repeat-containing protein, partial [Pseudomonadales bacterium]|nr:FG-GAP-like repeat-containing protein [Pseudomonadales bacterium]